MPVQDAAAQRPEEVLAALGSSRDGLPPAEVAARRAAVGPNAVRSHHARALLVLGRQLRSALLLLLLVTAVISFFLGEHTDAVIIAVILAASVGLGFTNEYRAERAAEALHSAVRHTVVAVRAGVPAEVDVTELVPGDVVRLALGSVVPADLRLVEVAGLECEESVLTGETAAAEKGTDPVAAGTVLAELSSCALMGTVVRSGSGIGVVVATGGRAEFGRIALGLGERQPETEFQGGLRRFSVLLLQVALALTTFIFVINLVLARPLLDSLLFSLAIAVGITPQLLPAVVSTSLATGSRRLAQRKVLVKRLVCIEDLGDMDVLVTDKTGTLTEGRIGFGAAVDPAGQPAGDVFRLGLLATETDGVAVGGNPMDTALWEAAGEPPRGYRRLGTVPFDHERRMTTALVQDPDAGRLIVTKGAPESVLARCSAVPPEAAATLQARFAAGGRVVAVASRPAPGCTTIGTADEYDLTLAGFLVFVDRPKADAGDALRRLAELGVTVKIATGDNPLVAEKVCAELGLSSGGTLTGSDIETMDDDTLVGAAGSATIFARVSPEQKARLIRLLRRRGRDVGFLGDGVNDALALHAADVGLSVDTATDVAKDAADVLLLEKDLGVLAGGVAEGRRIFANTIKYVLMGTSSNFGNMFSAASAAAVLPFLPMLPSQILLNNLLYDAGQLAIPTDRVDAEQLRAPSHWDLHMIRRFMLFFGPISSLFDFVTFGIMLGILHAGPDLFRSGWFVESLATQTLVIFAIRTRRVPFLRSRPSGALLGAALVVVVVGIVLPLSPPAGMLGFQPLPIGFFLALVAMVVAYLVLIELAKRVFFAERPAAPPVPRHRGVRHRVHRRASRFTHAGPIGGPVRDRR
ncbi:magnesium-translocating P-type ATPase [Pseudonocardia acidicola]|uniref:Magnesium-transporting ATPase, P-type 1 n=1 Tax=Pseudonocardia acidicola TaxID=2724939 RepID=A0ABX1S9I4_9PSEU|nr:magnesium-translocating P-type ATPase [Pseudonocardia acidicola]NMH97532.1 magnesium-translocating P-type ATPase [Pseudonocardia acidicola]